LLGCNGLFCACEKDTLKICTVRGH